MGLDLMQTFSSVISSNKQMMRSAFVNKVFTCKLPLFGWALNFPVHIWERRGFPFPFKLFPVVYCEDLLSLVRFKVFQTATLL